MARDPRFDIVGWEVALGPPNWAERGDYCTHHAPPRRFEGTKEVNDRKPIRRDEAGGRVCSDCDANLGER